MSFYTDASLVMIPSGYKTSKVYSAKPVDGSGDLTFTRSNDTATRVNSSGLIEKVRQNQYYKSTAFTTSSLFATYNVSPVSLGTYPVNSSSLGYSFSITGTNQGFIVQLPNDTNIRSVSVYLKDWNTVDLYWTGSAPITTISDTGTINGYKRYVVVIPAGANNLYFRPNSNSGTATTVYATAPQIENGDYPTAYIVNDTTASAVSVGPVANLPRLDYSGGATCPSLLLEPQRTNLATYSEQFDNAAWTKTAIAVTANSIASPDGYTNADFLVPTATNGLHSCIQPVGISSGTYTLSVFAKQGGYKNLLVWFDGHSGGVGVNLDTLAVFRNENNSGYSIDDFGNGWIRISVTITASGVANPNIYVYNNAATPAISFAGDGTSGIYLWGAQAEVGAYATSYIPTLSAALTRGQELCSKTGISSLLGQSEGTCFIEVDIQRSQDTRLPFLINSPNAATLTSEAYFYINGSNNLIFEVVTAGVPQCSISSGTATTGVQKLAFAYKNNDFVFYKNGVQVGVDTSGTVTSGFDSLYVGSYNANNLNLNEPIKQALVFKTRLSNASLASLTTL